MSGVSQIPFFEGGSDVGDDKHQEEEFQGKKRRREKVGQSSSYSSFSLKVEKRTPSFSFPPFQFNETSQRDFIFHTLPHSPFFDGNSTPSSKYQIRIKKEKTKNVRRKTCCGSYKPFHRFSSSFFFLLVVENTMTPAVENSVALVLFERLYKQGCV